MSNFTLEGKYYNGREPLAIPATLFISGTLANFQALGPQTYRVADLRVSPRIGGADRFITLPDGGQFHCRDMPDLDGVPLESEIEGPVAWLEARLWAALLGIGLVACILAASYFYGLPFAAKYAARRIPLETEHSLGREAMNWLDKNKWFRPTTIDPEKQQTIRESFLKLTDGLKYGKYYLLEFRDSRFLGANAIALPGGTIVITDDMVKNSRSTDETLSVLAHELGHEELRHTMRHVLQDSAVALVAATITADAASLSVAVAGLPAALVQAKYSREFESEADDFAFKLMKEKGIPTGAFADLMERLTGEREEEEGTSGFFSTHPASAERIRRARSYK
jgi:predicted Zn-dependent protease